MARKNKIVVDPSGKDLKAFQSKFGDYWRQFINSPSAVAGLQYLRNKKLEEVALYTPDDIQKHGPVIIAELIGFLKLENQLQTLPEMQDFSVPTGDEGFIYLKPEQEAEIGQLQERFQEENKKQRYGH